MKVGENAYLFIAATILLSTLDADTSLVVNPASRYRGPGGNKCSETQRRCQPDAHIFCELAGGFRSRDIVLVYASLDIINTARRFAHVRTGSL